MHKSHHFYENCWATLRNIYQLCWYFLIVYPKDKYKSLYFLFIVILGMGCNAVKKIDNENKKVQIFNKSAWRKVFHNIWIPTAKENKPICLILALVLFTNIILRRELCVYMFLFFRIQCEVLVRGAEDFFRNNPHDAYLFCWQNLLFVHLKRRTSDAGILYMYKRCNKTIYVINIHLHLVC